jgi:protein-disulfide isomerase
MGKLWAFLNSDFMASASRIVLTAGVVFSSVYMAGTIKQIATVPANRAPTKARANVPKSVTTVQPPENAFYVEGSALAQIVVMEWGDNQCPYCARASQEIEPKLEPLVKWGKIQFASIEFPLSSIHPFAEKLSEAALCSGNRYFDVRRNERLHQKELQTIGLAGVLKASEFNLMDSCYQSSEVAGLVNSFVAEGNRIGVQGTPTFVVGRKASGKIVGEMTLGGWPEVQALLKKYGVA